MSTFCKDGTLSGIFVKGVGSVWFRSSLICHLIKRWILCLYIYLGGLESNYNVGSVCTMLVLLKKKCNHGAFSSGCASKEVLALVTPCVQVKHKNLSNISSSWKWFSGSSPRCQARCRSARPLCNGNGSICKKHRKSAKLPWQHNYELYKSSVFCLGLLSIVILVTVIVMT